MITREGAVAYYKAIARTMLPHVRNRPLSFKRWPDAIGSGQFFWEKDAPSFTPSWVKRFPVPRREGGPPIEYVVANDARTLVWLAKVGGIEIHPFLHKVPHIDVATHVVFDLDPGEGADILDCAKVALILRETLPLESFAKVSGSKGIQVYVPLNSGATHEVTETFARLVAEELARRNPELIVAKMAKVLRRGKVLIDWSQNADYKTTVAVYSLRATGLVSMPVKWEELKRPRKLTWTAGEAVARVAKLGDLFAPVATLKQQLDIGAPPSRRPLRRLPAGKDAGGAAGWKPALHIPKAGSQSGRRLFLIVKTNTSTELWLDMHGQFKRWLLGPKDRATPNGDLAIDPAWRRAEIPKQWQGNVVIQDSGAYEVVEGSWQRRRFDLWFSGNVMSGPWTLEKSGDAWRLHAAVTAR